MTRTKGLTRKSTFFHYPWPFAWPTSGLTTVPVSWILPRCFSTHGETSTHGYHSSWRTPHSFPLPSHVSDTSRVLFDVIVDPEAPSTKEILFEIAGPRKRLYFAPTKTRAGIVTCSGLCPGLNNVISALVLEINHGYGVGVREILGFRNGYQGLDPWRGAKPISLTHKIC